jgi:hypothetical protein
LINNPSPFEVFKQFHLIFLLILEKNRKKHTKTPLHKYEGTNEFAVPPNLRT